ncbi:MAG: AcrR family transcriptional regulator [Rhodothermales bacterium]|jgi:AcrR family transcriptional regulator
MRTTKRESICEAALFLIAQNGVDATTTRKIAERAATSEGNLYRHFKSKDDLVRHLFAHSVALLHDTLVRSTGDETDPVERLVALMRGVFDFAAEHPEPFNYLLSVHHTGVLATRDNPLGPLPLQMFVDTIKTGMSSGEFREVQPVLASGWMVSMAQRAVVMMASGLISISQDEVITRTVDAALRLVQNWPEYLSGMPTGSPRTA